MSLYTCSSLSCYQRLHLFICVKYYIYFLMNFGKNAISMIFPGFTSIFILVRDVFFSFFFQSLILVNTYRRIGENNLQKVTKIR